MIPPYIPSYFNAGHHLHLFTVAAYLRANTDCEVDAIDGAALNKTWKDVCDILIKQYDVVALLNDYDGVDTFERFIYYTRTLSPQTQLVTFGRLSKEIPRFFLKLGFDAVHFTGDYEAGLFSYIQYLSLQDDDKLYGFFTQDNPFHRQGVKGHYLPKEEWVLPDVTEIPYQAYTNMYRDDFNKFCGIPDRQELVVPVSRGCPIGCFFCDVPKMQGDKERRLSVDRTIDYIKQSFNQLSFDYVSFYAPTFTLNKQWVFEFCDKISQEPKTYPWKCATALCCLSQKLIEAMARANCVRISLGIETLSSQGSKDLPKCKQDAQEEFDFIVETTKRYGIELNAFVMLGLPNDTPEDVEHTINRCLENNVRVRPTIYTPYHLLHDNMSTFEVSQFNRQLFVPDTIDKTLESKYYEYFYNNQSDKFTTIMNKIPKHEFG